MELCTWLHPFSHISSSPLGVVGYVSDLADGKLPGGMTVPEGQFGEVELPPSSKRCTETIHSFLAQCLQVDPLRRLSTTELLRHPFITTTKEDRKHLRAKRAVVRNTSTVPANVLAKGGGGGQGVSDSGLGTDLTPGLTSLSLEEDYWDEEDEGGRRESCFGAWTSTTRPAVVVSTASRGTAG